MKRLLLTGFVLLALARFASAQPSNFFINNGNFTSLQQIDAINFVNNGNFTGSVSPLIYDFSDVLNYTNTGTMTSFSGFLFNTQPSGSGTPHMAASFRNSNLATITANGGNLLISVTNLVNTGNMTGSSSGRIGVEGGSLNFSRGTMSVPGFSDSGNAGIAGASINNWGLNLETNRLTLANFSATNFSTPLYNVTNASGTVSFMSLGNLGGGAFAFTNTTDPSNLVYQVVFISNTNLQGITTDVRFQGGGPDTLATPVIRWQAAVTNLASGAVFTNSLYLQDTFGSRTNFQFLTNSTTTLSGIPLLAPANYSLSGNFNGFNGLQTNNSTPYNPATIFSNAFDTNFPFSVTNQFSAQGYLLSPLTFQPDPSVPDSAVTNIPGRIEVNASQVLDLTLATITGPNYLSLVSTNHFAGSANAQISAPFLNINLGTTNGLLNITNLVLPSLPRFQGTIDVYSARWTNTIMAVLPGTNTNAVTITNTYHVMFVDASSLLPTSTPQLQNFTAHSGNNVVVSDQLNITSNLFVDAPALTIASNGPGAFFTSGAFNLDEPDIIWSTSLPNLQFLTNFGSINAQNTIFFQKRFSPDFPTPSDGPYVNFVNHGQITSAGSVIWANNVTNSGGAALIISSLGPISVRANNALLSSGVFLTSGLGGIDITAGTLTVSNHTMQVNGALTLDVTNQLNGTSDVSVNNWLVNDGFNLLAPKPTTGDLMGTTISDVCPPGSEVDHSWAGIDRGAVAAGYVDNVALNHLILNASGNKFSSFRFSPASSGNAIYVQLLEFQNGATGSSLNVDPGMKLYFAQAKDTNGVDITAMLASAGIPRVAFINHPFPRPVFTSQDVHLAIAYTNQPSKAAVISWQTPAGSTNNVFYKTTVTGSNWAVLTNFVQGATGGPVSVTDQTQGNTPRFYKVRIDPAQ